MVFNVVMRMEREQFFSAEHYERIGKDRRGYANGHKPKRLATQVGMLDVQVPKTANHRDTPFYPSTLARGQRISQAVQSAAKEYYFQGVSTRNVETNFRQFGTETLSSNQVSKANKMLDEQFEAWRNRRTG